MDCFQRFLSSELVRIRWDVSKSMTSNLLFGSCPRYTSPLFRLQGPPLIKHFNVIFGESLSPACEQSIDKHMTKSKRKYSYKHCFQLKPIEWGFQWCWRCSTGGNLYETFLSWEETRNKIQSWWKCCAKSLTISKWYL